MRQYVRVTVAVLLAYLIQSTVLPYFKINGVMIDAMAIILFAIGHALGPYAAVPAGVLCALIMEVVSGDLPGLTAVYCVAAAGLGAWAEWYIPRKTETLRDNGRTIRRFAPMALLTLFETVKELIFVGYFFLLGIEVGVRHGLKAALSGVIVGLLSFVLFPLTHRFLIRRPEDTLLARWARRRKARREPKAVHPQAETPGMPAKGGADA